ncbi:hypothetical protein [Cloacibacillus porcorum]
MIKMIADMILNLCGDAAIAGCLFFFAAAIVGTLGLTTLFIAFSALCIGSFGVAFAAMVVHMFVSCNY